jgi:HD-GYP domain-containing protein (c-di-GMP phosphodiesterase class II)
MRSMSQTVFIPSVDGANAPGDSAAPLATPGATLGAGAAAGAAAAAAQPVAQPLSALVLETLAARFRPSGLCLMLVRPDNTVSYYDAAAGEFFCRFARPLIQHHLTLSLGERLASLPSNPPSLALLSLPGLALGALANVDRRQRVGTLLLVGKSVNLMADPDVPPACESLSQLPADVVELSAPLPAYAAESIQPQGALLAAMVRDQSRLAAAEQELNTLSSQLGNTYEELSLIYRISGGMRVNRRPAEFFQQACLEAIDVMNVRGMGVALRHARQLELEPRIFGPLQLPAAAVERLSHDLLEWLSIRKTPLLINNFSKDKRISWLSAYASRLLAVPLQRGDQVLGVLFTLDKESGEFDSVDAKLLTSIANESAIYLENAVLFEDVHGLMMGLLHSLTSAVDAKDAYTCGHSERVAMLSKLIAQNAGLDEAQVDRIYMAGLLHDVGKIGVAESILQKPGRLTDEEFTQMKRHPEIGAHILADVKQVQDIIPGVMHHHERFDGRGYPARLAGRDIPMMGRIICLADCFDAMTSTRTYRKAMPLEVALADMRRCSGTQFDPALTEAFLQIDMESLREVLRHSDSSRRLNAAQPIAPTAAPTPVVVVREKAA